MVRNMCPHAIIAVISGNFPEDILEQTAMCADVMIEKPVKLDTLIKLVDSAEQIKGALSDVRQLDSFKKQPN